MYRVDRRGGLGINRSTWNLGRAVGGQLKRAYNDYSRRPQAAPAAKRARTSSSAPSLMKARVGVAGSGGSVSEYLGKIRKAPYPASINKAIGKQTLTRGAPQQIVSTIGKQNAALVMEAGGQADFNQLTTSTKVFRYVMETIRGETRFVNAELSNVSITIYDCIAKRDIANSSVDDPMAAWIRGNTDQSLATNYQTIGSTPWQVEAFNTYYTVAKKTELVLGGGEMHTHAIHLKPNLKITGAYAGYTTTFKDATYFQIVVVKGQPANDTVTQTQVSVGRSAVNIENHFEIDYRQLANAQDVIMSTSSYPTSFTVAEQVVNTGGSTITTNTE